MGETGRLELNQGRVWNGSCLNEAQAKGVQAFRTKVLCASPPAGNGKKEPANVASPNAPKAKKIMFTITNKIKRHPKAPSQNKPKMQKKPNQRARKNMRKNMATCQHGNKGVARRDAC